MTPFLSVVSRLLLVAGIVMTAFAADHSRPLTEMPFRPEFRGLAFVAGKVNGERSIEFLLDTGGSGSFVDRELAKALGMKLAPGQASVWGNAALEVGVAPDALLQVGKVAFRTTAVVQSLDSMAPAFGHRIDGIVGGDFIRQFVVELDYERNVMSLFRTADYQYAGHGAKLPISVVQRIPFVTLEVSLPNGRRIRGPFLIDSGDAVMTVHICRPIAERQRLLDGLVSTITETSRGIGGTAGRITTRGEMLSIGPYRLLRPLVSFTDDTSEVRANPEAVGSIGIEVLRRFKLTLDYSRKLLYLEPNRRLKQEFIYDSSGLRLRSAPPSFTSPYISRVVEGSPAQQAGMQPEDVLLEIDGTDLHGSALESARNLLYEPGRSHRIAVERHGKRIEFLLQTRDILP